ncbi:hypothetical protein E3N88_32413 [Mikania micrantha]|uniref:Retroviral polymerase SH3-like domain-containing protein n=1 Tax=Mikania micrantha TaxID=192012 RepID=A0A5N6M8F4_9ASTR|nr:hypothetical protein E3N88_32413 [Mikania micrantha]
MALKMAKLWWLKNLEDTVGIVLYITVVIEDVDSDCDLDIDVDFSIQNNLSKVCVESFKKEDCLISEKLCLNSSLNVSAVPFVPSGLISKIKDYKLNDDVKDEIPLKTSSHMKLEVKRDESMDRSNCNKLSVMRKDRSVSVMVSLVILLEIARICNTLVKLDNGVGLSKSSGTWIAVTSESLDVHAHCVIMNLFQSSILVGAECYFVGYSGKTAYRVYNKLTKQAVESYNVHWFEENPTDSGSGPAWIFDYATLFKSFQSLSASISKEYYESCVEEEVFHSNKPHTVPEEYLVDLVTPVVATNLPTLSNVPDMPTPFSIHKYHPLDKVVEPIDSGAITRSAAENLNDCMFSCFVSQIELKNIPMALQDSSCIYSMQEELNQFAKLKVWTLVENPYWE